MEVRGVVVGRLPDHMGWALAGSWLLVQRRRSFGSLSERIWQGKGGWWAIQQPANGGISQWDWQVATHAALRAAKLTTREGHRLPLKVFIT